MSEARLAQLEAQVQTLLKRTTYLEGRVEELETDNGRLRAENRRLKRENRKLTDENRWLRREVRRLGGKVEPPPEERTPDPEEYEAYLESKRGLAGGSFYYLPNFYGQAVRQADDSRALDKGKWTLVVDNHGPKPCNRSPVQKGWS